MLWGGNTGTLEIRSEGGETHLSARFPYGAETELAPGRREVIAPRAFRARIEAGEEIHLLSGHDYTKPLASTAAGNLTLRDTETALELRATVDGSTSWAADFLAAHRAGLIRGLSPGFRVDTGGDKVERRGAEMVRTVTRAALFEISAVTVPAYPSAQIEARAWSMGEHIPSGLQRTLNRWRA
ncbi:hypothetical protein DL1_18475 [Thioclava dalianensis]|uniref:Prohead serine protease domain-containing protein n=1 Tax=Thioclava dalianensis TaxID=1185766 RepID=A0A074TZK9_9RHOB|nr:HK97 family phage prohead protease [Thioclava dalianensis]KEP67857.1 hypothetical protein DL1_18475 [Thioclava dalianensis]SFN36116.1 hypothetical protein SAMN05216224_104294 [Thioclava dalianensis]